MKVKATVLNVGRAEIITGRGTSLPRKRLSWSELGRKNRKIRGEIILRCRIYCKPPKMPSERFISGNSVLSWIFDAILEKQHKYLLPKFLERTKSLAPTLACRGLKLPITKVTLPGLGWVRVCTFYCEKSNIFQQKNNSQFRLFNSKAHHAIRFWNKLRTIYTSGLLPTCWFCSVVEEGGQCWRNACEQFEWKCGLDKKFQILSRFGIERRSIFLPLDALSAFSVSYITSVCVFSFVQLYLCDCICVIVFV